MKTKAFQTAEAEYQFSFGSMTRMDHDRQKNGKSRRQEIKVKVKQKLQEAKEEAKRPKIDTNTDGAVATSNELQDDLNCCFPCDVLCGCMLLVKVEKNTSRWQCWHGLWR